MDRGQQAYRCPDSSSQKGKWTDDPKNARHSGDSGAGKKTAARGRTFLAAHPDYESLTTISDRLKFCRYRKNLTRKQASFLIGDSSGTYSDLETEKTTYTSPNLRTRICTLFEIPLTDIQNEYTAFLEAGQGSQLQKLRESLPEILE